jgi:hypothetical protein
MAKTNEPQDLGRFDEIDERHIDTKVVLLGRFGVVGQRRRFEGGEAIMVEDLDRKLGSAPGHRLELHLLSGRVDRSRLKRASSIGSGVQPRVRAIAELGPKFVLICEPAIGVPVVSAPPATVAQPLVLEPTRLLALAIELADLLAELHEVGVQGVRFTLQQLRVEDGRYALDGLSHVLVESSARERDIEAVVEFLRELGGSAADIPTAASARELSEQFKALSKSLVKFELLPDPPFVGRAQALAALEVGISQAHIAKPTAIVVQGERGVGKSRLLREFASAHQSSSNVLVLVGSWQAQSGDTRSGLLGALDQLSQVLPLLDPDERDDIRLRINRATSNLGAILVRSAPTLGGVLRHHAEGLPQLALGGDFSRHTAVIADVLKSLGTRQRPLLLVLDNLESIDANSGAVLDIITQSRPAHYTLVVLGLRAESGTRPSFDHELIELSPLTVDDVGECLVRSLPGQIEGLPHLQQTLWSASAGLPLALGATLRTWLERGRITRDANGNWQENKAFGQAKVETPSAHELYRAKLAAVAEPVQLLALQLAVFGVDLRREYIDYTDPSVETALSELCERGLLIPTETGFRFPHDTIRELVLESLPEAKRKNAHRLAAAILAKHQAPLSQIVYHRDWGLDEKTATPEALDKLSRLHVEAGRDRLDVYDLERARWHLERALEHSRDPEQRGLAAEGLADICLLQEDLDAAVALYTAIIATAAPATGVRVAAKAVQFLWSKSANVDAKQLGMMALEMAGEPTPTSAAGKVWVLVSSLTRSWLFGECKLDIETRDALCRLYMYLLYIGLIDDPISVPMYAARTHYIAVGMRTGAAAMSIVMEAALAAVLGWVKYAERAYGLAHELAHESKDVWAQGIVFHHWGGALLGIDRYSEGQDRLDDAIAAFRETGDVSIALLSFFYKALYGRDRERADVILTWIDEALITARRNGKRAGIPTLHALKVHVLARQGHPDLREQILTQIEALKHDEMPGIERLVSHIQLAYAALESSNLDLTEEQVRSAQAYADDMGNTVPEFCQEVHLVAALFQLARPSSSLDRKALQRSVRKFRNAVKRAPRLRVLGDFLELKLAVHAENNSKIRESAAKIVTEFDKHENLHAVRHAHQAMARQLKAEDVLAALEHDRLAQKFGRRLGLLDHVLLSDFTELGREVGMLALSEMREAHLTETQDGILPATGMLSSVGSSLPKVASTAFINDDGAEVREAWLTESVVPHASLDSILAPVWAAVSGSLDVERLQFDCENPDLDIPIDASALQVLLVNMLLVCRDAVGADVDTTVRLDDTILKDADEVSKLGLSSPGHYLIIRVSVRGKGTQVPILNAFTSCANIAREMGGVLRAAADRGKVTLVAHIRLDATSGRSGDMARDMSWDFDDGEIWHDDADR